MSEQAACVMCSLLSLFEWRENQTVSNRACWEALMDGTVTSEDLEGVHSHNDLGPLKMKLDKIAREAEERRRRACPASGSRTSTT
jgi:hypothetical protein